MLFRSGKSPESPHDLRPRGTGDGVAHEGNGSLAGLDVDAGGGIGERWLLVDAPSIGAAFTFIGHTGRGHGGGDYVTDTNDPVEREVIGRLSTLDRFLPLWIVVAMAAGLILGKVVPNLQGVLDAVKIDNTSLLIAIGLFAMMYPVLARVRYEELGHLAGDGRMLWLSLLLNWIVGPLLMFALAWTFLANYPAFRTGLIVIGLARCIAMVLIWNDLACGDREAGALLVAINSIFQILAYALLGTFYLAILPGWLGLDTQDVAFSTWGITKAVLIFLGIPLALGLLTRRVGIARKGREWYDTTFAPRIAPIAL